jgi:hypothetical protein
MTTKTEAIRALNDELRQNLSAGTALITAGVAALGAEAVARIVNTYRGLRRLLPRQRPIRRTRLRRVRSRWRQTLLQDRLLRQVALLPLPRSFRSIRDRTRDHDHAGGGILMSDEPRVSPHVLLQGLPNLPNCLLLVAARNLRNRSPSRLVERKRSIRRTRARTVSCTSKRRTPPPHSEVSALSRY